MGIIINGERLQDSAVEYEYQRLLQFYSTHMPADQLEQQTGLLRKKAEEQAVGARLLMADAEAQDITVPEYEVDQRVTEMVEASGGVEGFQDMLVEQQITEETVRESIRNSRKIDILVQHLTADLQVPSDADIKAFFDAHTDDYMLPERVLARHILAQPDSESAEDKVLARTKLTELREQILGGADFEDVAWTHSDCPSGRNAKGQLGWIGKGTLVNDLDDILFELEIGALSDVVETQLGLHIIEVLDRKEPGPADFDDVYEQVKDFMVHAQRGDVIAAYVAELKKNAVIQED